MSENLVNLSEAARRLIEMGDKVDRSTLSRYVRQHAVDLKPEERGRQTVVNFDHLALHRRTNAKVTGGQSLSGEASFGAARAKKTDAEWRRIELDLGRSQGVLTVVREVENAAHAAVAALRGALSNAAGDTAETIARVLGVEASIVRPHIKAYERLALTAFIQAVTEGKLIRDQEAAELATDDRPGPGGEE